MRACKVLEPVVRSASGTRHRRVMRVALSCLIFLFGVCLAGPVVLAAGGVPAGTAPAAPVTVTPVSPAPAPAAKPPEAKPSEDKPPEGKPKESGLMPLFGNDKPKEVNITADAMDMDFGKHISTFLGNVLVVEARMRLQADKMVVHFGEGEKPERIEAIGSVVIHQPEANRTARAGRAEYDIVKGTIVLLENPSLQMGDNSLSGASKITYYRDNDRVICDGGKDGMRPVIQLVPKDKPDVPALFKSPPKDAN